MKDETVYKFSLGPPAGGILGLPHEITKSEAIRRGVLDILEAAIENKSYKPVKKNKPTQPKEEAEAKE